MKALVVGLVVGAVIVLTFGMFNSTVSAAPPTTEPSHINEPIEVPTDTSEPLVTRSTVLIADPEPDECLNGTTRWGLLPCDPETGMLLSDLVEPPHPTTTVVAVGEAPVPTQSQIQPVHYLPETGMKINIAIIATLTVALGVVLTALAQNRKRV